MSLPSFPDKGKTPTREEVINQIISSIAMEELGLSHIINAEGEKLQYALGTIPGQISPEEPLTMEELLKLNDSVHKTLDSTMMNQFFLKEKLVSALAASVMQGPTGPAGPQGPTSIKVKEEADNLEPGATPYVKNDGTPGELELRFGIPRGATGPIGAQGPQGVAGSQGSQGPQGPKGDQGPQGPQGMQGLALADGQPLFIISGTDGSSVVGYNGSLGFESNTLDITVETGPTVKIENPKAHAGAIIPFASGKALEVNTQTLGGGRSYAAILGFGSGGRMIVPVNLTQSITLAESSMADTHFAFPMPANGIITSMRLTASIYALSGILNQTNVVTARLYYSDTPDNVFKPFAGATASFNMPAVTSGMSYHSAVNDKLSIPVNAGIRLLFLIDTTTPDYTGSTLVNAHWCGSIKIEEP